MRRSKARKRKKAPTHTEIQRRAIQPIEGEQSHPPEGLFHGFNSRIKFFVHGAEGLANTLPSVMNVVVNAANTTNDSVSKFLDENAKESIKEGDSIKYKIPIDKIYDVQRLASQVYGYSLSLILIPRSFIVSLVSLFDAFLGKILKEVFSLRPEIINASDKQITFSQLSSFESIDDARNYILEKEIETILRLSHIEQFKKMEGMFGMPLTKDLLIFSDFIEVTERRNLFVHCDGVVSNQYLTACKLIGISLDESIKSGSTLNVDPKYFNKAFNAIFEVGVKLGHVLWRKFKPDELDKADMNLIDIIYSLLCKEMFHLAKTMSHFGSSVLPRISNDQLRKVFTINKAIACKRLGQKDEMEKIIEDIDWSAADLKFQIALLALREDWVGAKFLMKKIGQDGSVTKSDYINWPLFKEFRDTKEFQEGYQSVFKEKYTQLSDIQSDICDITPAQHEENELES